MACNQVGYSIAAPQRVLKVFKCRKERYMTLVSAGRIYVQLRLFEVICNGDLTQDGRLPYMVQIQGKEALAYAQGKSRSLSQGL